MAEMTQEPETIGEDPMRADIETWLSYHRVTQHLTPVQRRDVAEFLTFMLNQAAGVYTPRAALSATPTPEGRDA